jgi:hypothetical protein
MTAPQGRPGVLSRSTGLTLARVSPLWHGHIIASGTCHFGGAAPTPTPNRKTAPLGPAPATTARRRRDDGATTVIDELHGLAPVARRQAVPSSTSSPTADPAAAAAGRRQRGVDRCPPTMNTSLLGWAMAALLPPMVSAGVAAKRLVATSAQDPHFGTQPLIRL